MPFQIIRNDITNVKADAIVNSANPIPTYAGAVDRSIYLAAGANELLIERRKIGVIPVGEAAFTPAFNLPAKYIIHTVGPIWRDGHNNERTLLESCYNTSLNLAKENRIKTIAFPAISCGVYHFPLEEACKIATDTVREFITKCDCFEKVIFIDINDAIIEIYKRILN